MPCQGEADHPKGISLNVCISQSATAADPAVAIFIKLMLGHVSAKATMSMKCSGSKGAGRSSGGNLLAGSVPHDDLAIVAPSCDHFRLHGVALEAEHLIRGLQNQLRMDWIPEVPDEHCMGGWSAAQGIHTLVEGLWVSACHCHHTLQWRNGKMLPLHSRAFTTDKSLTHLPNVETYFYCPQAFLS